jgi:tetratricopeptide (TPR) repeat protein
MPRKKRQFAGPPAKGGSAAGNPSRERGRADLGREQAGAIAGVAPASAPATEVGVKRSFAGAKQSFALPASEAGWAERRFWLILGLICLVSLVCRLAILAEYTARNPLSAVPLNDAQTYWDWAERIAHGKLIGDTPFFSAPLYPYLLGLVRAVGGSLRVVYLLQILADLATAGLLAYAARGRFGARVGLLAAALFLLLEEPASFSLRILTCSLQLLLLAVTYLLMVRVQSDVSGKASGRRRAHRGGSLEKDAGATGRVSGRHAPALLGCALGLLCLSYAPAMLLAVAVVPWLFLQSGRTRRDALRAVTPLGVAALLIAPATLYNWHASGNFFLIQSVTAVNLRQGNQPESVGVYTPIPHTTIGRDRLFDDVARQYELAHGRRGSWADIDRYYRDLVWKFWQDGPVRAVKLAARKFYYFLTWRYYGDIYQPEAEFQGGLDRLFWLTPLPLPWLIGPTLVGLVLLGRRPIRYAPELLIFLIPLIVVTVHWYTPRYRLPAIPAIVVVAAWVFERALHWRAHSVVAVAAGALLAVEAILGPVNRDRSFDVCDPAGVMFHIGDVLCQQGKSEEAAAQFRRGLQIRPNDPLARIDLGDILYDQGRHDEALAEYEHARQFAPDHPELLGRIARGHIEGQRLPEARAALERALPRDPHNRALLQVAADCYQRVLRADPDDAEARSRLTWVAQQLQAGKQRPMTNDQ